MRSFLRPLVAVVALVGAACSDSTSPAPPLNPAGLTADLGAAVDAAGNPAVASLATLGEDIGVVIGGDAEALGVAGLPAQLLLDPMKANANTRIQRIVIEQGTHPAVIPEEALGRTFVYDSATAQYVVSERIGAPTNGVRFVLYAVDPITSAIVFPLVETGYVDITRSLVDGVATARVEAYSGGETPDKVLDYSASYSESPAPAVLVRGFAKNGVDSLTFRLATAVSLVASRYTLDWRAEVPTRDFVTRVTQAVTFGEESISIVFDALLRSGSGNVSMKGTLNGDTGGSVTVRVNGDVFATIEAPGEAGGDPEIVGADGEPLSAEEITMLQQIFEWFGQSFFFLAILLAPVEGLLAIGFAPA